MTFSLCAHVLCVGFSDWFLVFEIARTKFVGESRVIRGEKIPTNSAFEGTFSLAHFSVKYNY